MDEATLYESGGRTPVAGSNPVIGAMELLTHDEHNALDILADLSKLIYHNIIGRAETRDNDWNEVGQAIHVIQNMILAQAAARAYPDRYRLMGETFNKPA